MFEKYKWAEIIDESIAVISGLDVPQEDRKDLEDRLLNETSTMPVFVDNELAESHYNGFSNR